MPCGKHFLLRHHFYAKEFVLVGGTALLYLGSTRSTGDVDFLITAQSLNAFEAAAKKE